MIKEMVICADNLSQFKSGLQDNVTPIVKASVEDRAGNKTDRLYGFIW